MRAEVLQEKLYQGIWFLSIPLHQTNSSLVIVVDGIDYDTFNRRSRVYTRTVPISTYYDGSMENVLNSIHHTLLGAIRTEEPSKRRCIIDWSLIKNPSTLCLEHMHRTYHGSSTALWAWKGAKDRLCISFKTTIREITQRIQFIHEITFVYRFTLINPKTFFYSHGFSYIFLRRKLVKFRNKGNFSRYDTPLYINWLKGFSSRQQIQLSTTYRPQLPLRPPLYHYDVPFCTPLCNPTSLETSKTPLTPRTLQTQVTPCRWKICRTITHLFIMQHFS